MAGRPGARRVHDANTYWKLPEPLRTRIMQWNLNKFTQLSSQMGVRYTCTIITPLPFMTKSMTRRLTTGFITSSPSIWPLRIHPGIWPLPRLPARLVRQRHCTRCLAYPVIWRGWNHISPQFCSAVPWLMNRCSFAYCSCLITRAQRNYSAEISCLCYNAVTMPYQLRFANNNNKQTTMTIIPSSLGEALLVKK